MNPDFDVRYTAGLARLQLSDEEVAKFQSQLGKVLEYVEKLKSVDVSNVEATAHANPVFNVVREDEPRDWFTQKEALSNAPRQANGLFSVPKVLD
jgi:aspartyl-tRNA(Asn)/glutamyl-tRNA(Gln) amidotransferase subunit C